MNCQRVEELFALYAGGDLSHETAQVVARHLRACETCQQSLSAFETSRELLAVYEPPEFDSAFFDSIRQNVIREIAKQPSPKRLAFFNAISFNRRLAYASMLALIVGGLAIAIKRIEESSTELNHQTAKVYSELRDEKDDQVVLPLQSPRRTSSPASFVRQKRVRQNISMRPRPSETTHKALKTKINDLDIPLVASQRVNEDSETANLTNDMNGRMGLQVAALETPLPVAPEPKMLRIELQTGNPDVRIIWLSPEPGASKPKP